VSKVQILKDHCKKRGICLFTNLNAKNAATPLMFYSDFAMKTSQSPARHANQKKSRN
jgi:hypothetical protein